MNTQQLNTKSSGQIYLDAQQKKNKFQPIYVNDLVDGIIIILKQDKYKGQLFEFGGPDIMTMEEVYRFLMRELKIKRLLIPTPVFVASLMAQFIQLLPNPIITTDLVKALEIDNIVNKNENDIRLLNIEPKSPYSVVPTYLQIAINNIIEPNIILQITNGSMV